MKRQKSFHNDKPTLYLVATPIGNLAELTNRAVDILKAVDVIACEDSRTSKVLLDHYSIKTHTISYHNFNEEDSAHGLIKLLEEGKDVALISDAGYPLISDPGYALVNKAVNKDFNVVCISGANAALNALVASGLSTNHYLYYGFMSEKASGVKKELEKLLTFPYTMIFYEAPHRIKNTLRYALDILGNRKACIARELTKNHEEYIRGTLEEMQELDDLKGEIVLVIEGFHEDEIVIDYISVKEMVDTYISEGMSAKDAIKKTAKEMGISKNEIYNYYHAQNC